MGTLSMQSTFPELGVRAGKASPVIIATDGQAQSDAALIMGWRLAGSTEAMRVVSVVRPVPIIPESGMVINGKIELSRRADQQRDVIGQMTRTWGMLLDIEVPVGDPAAVVTKLAHESGATMIVCGLGRHRVADRVFGDETALRLIRMADVPVLATSGNHPAAPRRIVVACDFSEASLRAARMALELAAPDAKLHLLHVAPRELSAYDDDGGKAYKTEALDALERMRASLHIPEGMTVELQVMQGDAATEILAFSKAARAEMIATGSHGHGFVARMVIGSVATRILRLSTCSVLTVPAAAVMTDVGVPFFGGKGASPLHRDHPAYSPG